MYSSMYAAYQCYCITKLVTPITIIKISLELAHLCSQEPPEAARQLPPQLPRPPQAVRHVRSGDVRRQERAGRVRRHEEEHVQGCSKRKAPGCVNVYK